MTPYDCFFAVTLLNKSASKHFYLTWALSPHGDLLGSLALCSVQFPLTGCFLTKFFSYVIEIYGIWQGWESFFKNLISERMVVNMATKRNLRRCSFPKPHTPLLSEHMQSLLNEINSSTQRFHFITKLDIMEKLFSLSECRLQKKARYFLDSTAL